MSHDHSHHQPVHHGHTDEQSVTVPDGVKTVIDPVCGDGDGAFLGLSDLERAAVASGNIF